MLRQARLAPSEIANVMRPVADRPIRIVLPSPGSQFYAGTVVPFLNDLGFPDVRARRHLCVRNKEGVDFFFVRGFDIPWLVERGNADVGVAGYDCLVEHGVDVQIVCPLGRQYSKVILAVSAESPVREPRQLPNEARIATEYPRITQQFMKQLGKNADVRKVKGCTEVFLQLAFADAIVDLVTTGQTASSNRIRVIHKILDTQAHLIINKSVAGYLAEPSRPAHKRLAQAIRSLSTRSAVAVRERRVFVRSTAGRSDATIAASIRRRYPDVVFINDAGSEEGLATGYCGAADVLIFHFASASMGAILEAAQGRRHRKFVVAISPNDDAAIREVCTVLLPSMERFQEFVWRGGLDDKLEVKSEWRTNDREGA